MLPTVRVLKTDVDTSGCEWFLGKATSSGSPSLYTGYHSAFLSPPSNYPSGTPVKVGEQVCVQAGVPLWSDESHSKALPLHICRFQSLISEGNKSYTVPLLAWLSLPLLIHWSTKYSRVESISKVVSSCTVYEMGMYPRRRWGKTDLKLTNQCDHFLKELTPERGVVHVSPWEWLHLVLAPYKA